MKTRIIFFLALCAVSHAYTCSFPLDHVDATSSQLYCGPMQDDEQLFLFGLVNGMRMRTIVEIGGGTLSTSANNFLRAMANSIDPIVYSVDLAQVKPLAPNHVTIQKDARMVTAADFGNRTIDLILFDCHLFSVQMEVYERLVSTGSLTERTVIALHDTNTWPTQYGQWGCNVDGLVHNGEGWIHQMAERKMVNEFKNRGYDIFLLHPDKSAHTDSFRVRHGLAVCQKFKPLQNSRVDLQDAEALP